MAKAPAFKTGDKVEFQSGSKFYTGVMVNPAHYPSGIHGAGKHYRIKIDGMAGTIATIFAQGAVGQSVKVVS